MRLAVTKLVLAWIFFFRFVLIDDLITRNVRRLSIPSSDPPAQCRICYLTMGGLRYHHKPVILFTFWFALELARRGTHNQFQASSCNGYEGENPI